MDSGPANEKWLNYHNIRVLLTFLSTLFFVSKGLVFLYNSYSTRSNVISFENVSTFILF